MKTNTFVKILFSLLLFVGGSVNAEITYIHTDALGSVVAESDDKGEVVKRYHYKPYGKSDLSQDDSPGYTGHVFDDDLGLSYMKARYYDPEIGRFYSDDPVGFSPDNLFSFNRYAYANNNPYKFVDPDGEAPMFKWSTSEIGAGRGGIVRGTRVYVTKNGAIDSTKSFLTPTIAVKPGNTGTYRNLKVHKRKYGETEPLHMDHQPSLAAQIKNLENKLNRKLTREEKKILRDNTPAVASPKEVHQQTSPTYGGRNTPVQIENDAKNLTAAQQRDKNMFDEAMQNR